MRIGIRLQIVVALSLLLSLGLAPLFVAVAELTDATMRTSRIAVARALGDVVAGHVMRTAPTDPTDIAAWSAVLEREVRVPTVVAVAAFDRSDKLVASAGDPGDDGFAGRTGVLEPASSREPTSDAASTVVPVSAAESVFRVSVAVPALGTVRTWVSPPGDRDRASPLLRLVGLYTAMVALGLLVFAYIALTRMIVRPLESLSMAARRVAEGARKFDPPSAAAKELEDLGTSLSEMTVTLLEGEERMRAQIGELEARARELREAQDRLVRSERLASVGRLAAGLAHEIGNPIAAMMGLEDLLLQGVPDETEQRDFLVRIRAETERVHHVLRDLLDFARPTSLPPGASPKPGDVAAAIDDVFALVRPQKSFRNVRLEQEVEKHLPAVALERERIMQVLLNLLMNAADAIGPHGSIRLTAKRDGSFVLIQVEDDGPGVDSKVLSRLFEPFVTTKDVGKGTGLGLAVCRGLVEAAGGKITLENRVSGGGATFVVRVPIAAEA